MTTYTNITLLDVDQDEAVTWLAENGFTAAVTPVVEPITVIFDNVLADEADTEEPVEALLKLASEISYELGCAAWLVIVDADDAVLIYSLYLDGDLLDSYGVKGSENPDGGNPETLADTFGAPKRQIKHAKAALNRQIPDPSERHLKLIEALMLPSTAVGIGFAEVKAGKLPDGVESADEIVFIEPDESEADDA